MCQVLEYPDLGVLNVYLVKSTVVAAGASTGVQDISRTDMLTLSIDACRGVKYLASKGVCHGDLAARHCFVTSDRHLKLSCHELTQQSLMNYEYEPFSNRMIAIRWCAPEILNHGQTPTTHTDVWSLGVLMWEIFSKGKKPFSAMSIDEVASNVVKGTVHRQPEFANASVFRAMTTCWLPVPTDRPRRAIWSRSSNSSTALSRRRKTQSKSRFPCRRTPIATPSYPEVPLLWTQELIEPTFHRIISRNLL